MFKGFYNLTSGMLTHGKHLDVISNNISNVATSGFKVDRFTASTFQDVMWQRVGNRNKRYTELGMQSWITAPSELVTDYSQASFDDTGLPLDFAIEGEGYFAVETAEGRVYTRGGSFSLDNEGYLTLPGQGRVLSNTEEAILLATDKLETDGYGGLYTEEGGFLGRIGVFTFADETQPEKNAQGLFVSGAQGQPAVSLVHKGMLERSNMDWVQQMSEMIAAQRAYQSAAEVIKIYDDLINRATTEVGRM